MWNMHVLYVIWFHLLLYTQSCTTITNPFELTNKAFHFNRVWTHIYLHDSGQTSLNLRFSLCWLWRVPSSDTTCSMVQAYRRFGGAFCRHIQGRRVSQGRNRHIESRVSTCYLLAWHFFDPADGRNILLRNVCNPLSECTASHFVKLFRVTAMKLCPVHLSSSFSST
jgi:hypothetical protein